MTIGLRTNKLHGGLRFDKPTASGIENLPVPDRLKIALKQHQGLPGTAIVSAGDTVFKGQPLTTGDSLLQVPVHASSSGIIESVNDHFVYIKTDGRDSAAPSSEPTPDKGQWTQPELIQKLHNDGIVGLGGAGFPAARKIAAIGQPASVLLINAAECDPVIHCDDALMITYATQIVEGINLLAQICQVNAIFIGIEDNKPQASLAISNALMSTGSKATLVKVPAVYPSGAEHYLLQLCTDLKHSANSSLAAAAILSFNVATCYAIYNSLCKHESLISRVTTVVDSSGQHRNFKVRIGTPTVDLLKQVIDVELKTIDNFMLTSGGRMMSSSIDTDSAIIKTSNCISLIDRTTSAVVNSRPCIRCGACSDVCPEQLMPQHLYTHALKFNAESLNKYQLDRCIECSCCDLVCPSNLPLTKQFQQAKQQNRQMVESARQAELAKNRFEKRQTRLSNQNPLLTRRAAIKNQKPASTDKILSGTDQDEKKKLLIEAALRRTQQKNQHKDQTNKTADNNQTSATKPASTDKKATDL